MKTSNPAHEYDFTEGVRGKYLKRFQEGSNVVILDPELATAQNFIQRRNLKCDRKASGLSLGRSSMALFWPIESLDQGKKISYFYKIISVFVRAAALATLPSEWEELRSVSRKYVQFLSSNPQAAPSVDAQLLLISGEDRRHRTHCGFDIRAVLRALWRRLTSKQREGASTIEQQIVRVLTGRFERTLSRKIREILLASLFSYEFPKKIHPALYLYIGYYGWRMNGYDQALRRLHENNQTLTTASAAELVARLKYPEPQQSSQIRKEQINKRTIHLLDLLARHLRDGTYDHISKENGIYTRTPNIVSRRTVSATE